MLRHLPTPLTRSKAKELSALFFEGLTTEAEEQALKVFLALPDADSPEFDEIRAVFAFCAQARAKAAPAAVPVNAAPRRRRLRPQQWAAAACVALVAASSIVAFNYQKENQCVAYVGGEKITDTEQVVREMHLSIQNIGTPPQEVDVEAELKDMFKTMQ